MHPSVRAAWHVYSEPLEGRVHSLYVDVLGLVTTAVGVLVDPIHLALALPWKRPDGSLASETEIRADWEHVKNDRERLKKLTWKYAAPLTTIRLTDEDIDAIVEKKLASNEVELRKWFPGYDDAPADAQLGILSLAWATGPAFAKKFPNFTRSANAKKWWECAVSGQLRATGPDGTPNPGVVPRNRAQKLCFENAANVIANSADPSVLHWPSAYHGQLPRLDAPERIAGPGLAEALDAAREATRDEARANMAIDQSVEDEDTVPDLPSNRA